MRNRKLRVFVSAIVVALSLAIAGCRSHHIDSMIENRTSAVIHQIEVDYPSASFGINNLNPGQIYFYRFQVTGSGKIKLQYTDASGQQHQFIGIDLAEGDQGQFIIILLPDGKIQWVPSLNSKV